MIVELSFMFVIILGRWILPKGHLSHSALSQLLLVYLSLASDILDLLTLFGEQEIYQSSPMVHVVLVVFSLCMFQFALNLTATRGRSFRAEFDDEEIEVARSITPPMRRRLPSSSTRRPLAATTVSANLTPRTRPRTLSVCIISPTDTVFENTASNHDYEMTVLRPAVGTWRARLLPCSTCFRSKCPSRRSRRSIHHR